MKAGGPPGKAVLTRRSLLVGGIGLALLASGCRQEDDDISLLASAARGGDRHSFADAVAWTEFDGLTAVVVFVPWQLTDEQRQAVLETRSVYPALPSGTPLLEMRMEIKPGQKKEDLRINPNTLKSLQMTFWYFDEPAPVIRIEKPEWPSSSDIEVVGLDGEMKRGGWVVGTVRGKHVYRNPRDKVEAYLWNLKFIQSLV